MKGFITIVAASAVLSASLCAGLAATDNGRILRTQAAAAPASIAPVSAVQAPTAWIDPPAKADAACRAVAWPYRAAQCATDDGASAAPARKVRVIPTGAARAVLAQR